MRKSAVPFLAVVLVLVELRLGGAADVADLRDPQVRLLRVVAQLAVLVNDDPEDYVQQDDDDQAEEERVEGELVPEEPVDLGHHPVVVGGVARPDVPRDVDWREWKEGAYSSTRGAARRRPRPRSATPA